MRKLGLRLDMERARRTSARAHAKLVPASSMGPIERELRAGPQKWRCLADWIGFSPSSDGMSLQAFKFVFRTAIFHDLDKYTYPADTISYAIEAAEALGE